MPRYPAISRTYPLVPLGQPQARLKPRQWRRAAELEGFNPAEALQMSQIVHGEANFQPGVVQPDPGDGMVGRGGAQATPNAWGADSEAMRYYNKLGGDRAMGNPRKAMRMARFLYEKAGNSFSPWYGTKYLQQNVGNVPSVLKKGARAPGMRGLPESPRSMLKLTGIPQVEVGGSTQEESPTTKLIGIFNRMNQATGLGPQFKSALAPGVDDTSTPSVFDPSSYLKWTRSKSNSRSPGQDVAVDGLSSNLVQEATKRANILERRGLSYLWGGGHQASKINVRKTGPLDCSGAVSAVLGINPRVSGDFEKFGKPGRAPKGKGITIYANPEHVLMEINGKFFGTSQSNPGGGAGWIEERPSKEYLSRFTARYVT